MEIKSYTDLGFTSDQKPRNTHLLFETNSSGTLYLVDSADNKEFYKTTDKCATWTQLDVDPGDAWGGATDKERGYNTHYAWHDRGNTTIYLLDLDTVGDDAYIWKIDTSTDTVTELGSISKTDLTPFDIFMIGSDLFVIAYHKNAGQDQFEVWKWVDPNWVSQDTENLANLYFGAFGIIVGSIFYFHCEDASNNETYVYSYNNGTTTIASLLDVGNYDNPDEIGQAGMSYDDTNYLYFMVDDPNDGDQSKLVSYSISGNTASIVCDLNLIPMLDRNTASGVMEKAFHISEYKVYQLHTKLSHQFYFIASVDSDAALYAITDTFLMNSDGDMWEFEDITAYFDKCDIVMEVQTYPTCQLSLIDEYSLTKGMYIIVKDTLTTGGASSTAIVYEGYVEDFTDDPTQDVSLVSFAQKDLEQKPSGEYSGRTDEIIVDLIGDYCSYITAGTLSAGTAMGTIEFLGDRNLDTIFDELALTDGFIWYLTPEGELYYNNGTTDTAEDFTNASDIFEVRKAVGYRAKNYVNIKGGFVSNAQVSGTVAEDVEDQQLYGKNIYVRTISHLNTSALCTTTNTNVLARYDNQPILISFNQIDSTVGIMQIGETITFEYSPYPTVSSDQFLLIKAIYNALNGVANYIVSDELP